MTRFKNYIEYDRYMRPVCKLGRCHYKGGGGTTTTINKRDIPAQTAQEAQLEKELMAYQNTGLAGAKDLQARALDYINKTYNPDWTQLYNQYNGDINAALDAYNNTGDWYLDAYTHALKDNQDWFAQTSQDYADRMKKESADNLAQYNATNYGVTDAYKRQQKDALADYKDKQGTTLADYNGKQQSELDAYRKAQQDNLDAQAANNATILSDYDSRKAREAQYYGYHTNDNTANYKSDVNYAHNVHYNDMAKAARDYDAVENPAFKDYQNGMSEVNAGMKDVSNGVLAGDYAKNRRAALQDDLDATAGSLLSNMARRGIINSSVTNSGLDSINQSAADTLAKNYSSDLAQQAGLLGNRGSLLQNTYNTAHGKATDERNNAQTLANTNYGMRKDVADKVLANSQGALDNIYKAQIDTTNSILNQRNLTEQDRYKDQSLANDSNYNAGVAAADKAYNAGIAVNDKAYAADTALGKGILDTYLLNNNNWYKGAQNNTNSYYDMLAKDANTRYAGATADANNLYQAQSNYAKSLIDARQGTAQDTMLGAAMAQAQSYYAPSKMLDYAQNLYLPSQNQYNTMYAGRMGAAGTTSTTSKPSDDSNMWGVAGQLGAAAITACFVGDSLVAVPGGAVPIRDIKAGDTVLSLDDDDRICKRRVFAVNKPVIQPIVDVEFDNGTIWHTTDTQRAYTAPWFEYVERAKKPAVTMDGQAKIVNHERTNKQEFVYDIVVEDRNIFFVHGIAAEGFGD